MASFHSGGRSPVESYSAMMELKLFNIFLKCCEAVTVEVWVVK